MRRSGHRAEDEASLHGILELRQTVSRLTERLAISRPELVALLTRWQRHRISSRSAQAHLAAAGLAPVGRILFRSALIARAAARRVPLALSEPDRSPALAYRDLARLLAGVNAR
jgi:hypothetical protein